MSLATAVRTDRYILADITSNSNKFWSITLFDLIVRPVTAGGDPVGLPARRYTVDRHANIRITRMPQRRAGLHGPCLEIQAHAQELIVTAR